MVHRFATSLFLHLYCRLWQRCFDASCRRLPICSTDELGPTQILVTTQVGHKRWRQEKHLNATAGNTANLYLREHPAASNSSQTLNCLETTRVAAQKIVDHFQRGVIDILEASFVRKWGPRLPALLASPKLSWCSHELCDLSLALPNLRRVFSNSNTARRGDRLTIRHYETSEMYFCSSSIREP